MMVLDSLSLCFTKRFNSNDTEEKKAFVTVWMSQNDSVLSEISQAEKTNAM